MPILKGIDLFPVLEEMEDLWFCGMCLSPLREEKDPDTTEEKT